MTSNSNRISNLDYLNQLSNGNTEFVKEMVGIFLVEIPDVIKIFEKGIKEQNFEIIKQTAHNLRSTIPFVGLNKVIEKEVVEMESLADSRLNIEKIETLFAKVKEMCEKVLEELKEDKWV